MKKLLIVIAISLCISLLCLSCVVIFSIPKAYINQKKLDDLNVGSTEHVAYVVHHNYFFYKEHEVRFTKDLENGTLHQVYCIKDDNVYFSYQYKIDDELHWCIAYKNIIDEDVNVICDEVFEYQNKYTFNEDFSSDYALRNGYYFDDKIILTDFLKLIEYDTLTQNYKVFNYSDYKHPSTELEFEISKDNSCVNISNGVKSVLWDYDTFKQTNYVAEYVVNNYNKKTIGNISTFNYFFDEIQIINEEIYLICDVLDLGGSSYSLIFSVDVDSNEVEYLSYYYTDDPAALLYVVPVV